MGRRQLVAWELRESVLGEWWKPRTHSIPLPLSSNQTLDPVTYPFLLDSGGVVSSLKHVVNIRLELDNGAFEVLKTRIVIVPCQRGVELDAIASQFPEILPALPQYHQGNGGDCTGSVGSSNSDNNDDETELNIDVPAHPPLYNE